MGYMARNTENPSKGEKLKSALRDNLRKRKQFSRKLVNSGSDENTSAVKLRTREIATEKSE